MRDAPAWEDLSEQMQGAYMVMARHAYLSLAILAGARVEVS